MMSFSGDPQVPAEGPGAAASGPDRDARPPAPDFQIQVTNLSFRYRTLDTDSGANGLDTSQSGTGATTTQPDSEGLHHIELLCPRGSFTVLCGASGSGKSTLLRALNGLVPHFHEGDLTGSVKVAGREVPQLPQALVGIDSATVFQNPATQFFTADVSSELVFRGENYGLAPQKIIADCLQVVTTMNLEDLVGRSMGQLSGGEMQRVACAQAIISGQNVLLFDEPTSNLSPEAIDDFAEILAQLKTTGHTIVVAEHRLYYLRNLADTVLEMESGRILRRWRGTEFFAQSEAQRQAAGLRCLTLPPIPLTSPAAQATQSNQAAQDTGLCLENLRFDYGKHRVLDIPKASFPAGEVNVLIGENGAGKSTLARVICGLHKARRRSQVRLHEKRFTPRALMKASYIVMQDTGKQLFSESVLGEVTLGVPSRQADPQLGRKYLEKLGLEQLAARHPLSLSGGQKQRLVIAAALACNKEIYIFDEPSSGVDYRHMLAISTLLKDLAQSGKVVIVITHDQELVAHCADRIWKLNKLEASPGARSTLNLNTRPQLEEITK